MNKYDSSNIIGIPFVSCDLVLTQIQYGIPAVYGIRLISNDRVIYVGQAQCIRRRLQNHEHASDRTYFEMLQYEDCDDIDIRREAEAKFIRKFILQFEPLKNDCSFARAARRELEILKVA